MLDNLNGSGLSESEVVAKMQSARSGEDQDSAPIESTDETVDESIQEEVEESSDFEQEEIEADEEEAPETYRIKASGEELEVTFDDLVENFEKGQDYYKKTSRLAEERKAFEAESAQLKQQIELERQQYAAMTKELSEMVKSSEQDINWDELRETDPSEYLKQKEIVSQRKEALQAASQKLKEDQAKRRQEIISSESQKLLTVIGDEWKDPEVREKEFSEMQEVMLSYGVSPEEMGNMLDHRVWVMIRDAMRGRKLKETTNIAKKQVKSAPKSVKSKQPIKRAKKEVSDARERLRASGGKSTDDVVALMKAKRQK